jgi:hypothetical protein
MMELEGANAQLQVRPLALFRKHHSDCLWLRMMQLEGATAQLQVRYV